MGQYSQVIKEAVTKFFLESHDFNGIPLLQLFDLIGNEEMVRDELKKLVQEGKIECAFDKLSGNPHIRRLPTPSIGVQLRNLEDDTADEICCYPSADLVASEIDLSKYDDRPFTKALIAGSAQLEYLAFDLGVLERYFHDPRYYVSLYDYSGIISVQDEAYASKEFRERDKILLESFGLGYDESGHRLAVVFLRYLSRLSPQHQQYWQSFRHEGSFKILKEYYDSSFLGEWPDSVSYFQAIFSEITIINEATILAFGGSLFIDDFHEERPLGMTFFLRPTLKNFNEFVLALDKALSENIDKRFFEGQISMETEEKRRDGKIIVREKQTITLLKDWLRKKVKWADENKAIKIIVGPLKQVRELRQKPAHKIEENQYDEEYERQQHQILESVYLALMHLRKILLRHPSAVDVDIPLFLVEGRIVFF